MPYVIQEKYLGGDWSDTLPVLATEEQAEAYLEDVEATADVTRFSYRIAPATGLYALEDSR